MAPPVPKKPAKKPDKLPPIKVSFSPVLKEKLGLTRKNKLKPTKNTDKAICRYKKTINLLKYAPIITKMTEGIPICKRSFLSSPFLKR